MEPQYRKRTRSSQPHNSASNAGYSSRDYSDDDGPHFWLRTPGRQGLAAHPAPESQGRPSYGMTIHTIPPILHRSESENRANKEHFTDEITPPEDEPDSGMQGEERLEFPLTVYNLLMTHLALLRCGGPFAKGGLPGGSHTTHWANLHTSSRQSTVNTVGAQGPLPNWEIQKFPMGHCSPMNIMLYSALCQICPWTTFMPYTMQLLEY